MIYGLAAPLHCLHRAASVSLHSCSFTSSVQLLVTSVKLVSYRSVKVMEVKFRRDARGKLIIYELQ